MKLGSQNSSFRLPGQKSRAAFPNGVRAFSLAEALVGIALVSAILVSTYVGTLAGFQTVQLTREDLRATQIMMEKLEAIRLSTWDQLHTNVPSTLDPDYFFPSGVSNGAGGTLYTGTISIHSNYNGLTITNGPLSESYSNDVRLVVVTLVWTNGLEFKQGSNNVPVIRTRSMSTYVSRNGLQSYIFKY